MHFFYIFLPKNLQNPISSSYLCTRFQEANLRTASERAPPKTRYITDSQVGSRSCKFCEVNIEILKKMRFSLHMSKKSSNFAGDFVKLR